MLSQLNEHLPWDWSFRHDDYLCTDYKLVEISSYDTKYDTLQSRVSGSFNVQTNKIVSVENPYLYGKFLLKKAEYESRLGYAAVKELYHDTAARNIRSIISSNLDWRRAKRFKYGRGVSFSPLPSYTNQVSSPSNGTDRAMIIADVLVGRPEAVNVCKELPNPGCDTTVGNFGRVYVKFYDNEFYPKYVVYYESKPHVYEISPDFTIWKGFHDKRAAKNKCLADYNALNFYREQVLLFHPWRNDVFYSKIMSF